MDELRFVGCPASVVKKQLEEQGYSVKISSNWDPSQKDGDQIVVAFRKLEDKSIELVAGKFKFLN